MKTLKLLSAKDERALLIDELTKLENGSQLLYEPIAFDSADEKRFAPLRVDDPYGLIGRVIKLLKKKS